jgi:serine/threonine-protein kinase
MSDTQAPIRRRPDVSRLFSQTAASMGQALQDETRRVAERVFFQVPEAGAVDRGPVGPGDQLGPYRVERLLGLGGQAYVYAATHLHLGRSVALKVPRREVAERLLNEGRLAASLQHPRIARVEDVAEADGTPYLVMEHCEGGSLDEQLELHPEGLPMPEVQRIGAAVLEALEFAHGKGIVHRDVKPANVLFDAHGQVKLGDLGTGTVAMNGAPLVHSVEVSGPLGAEIAGTPLYMSPEQENPQLLAGGTLDGRSDLFSFGKMLFLLLTGSSPRTIRPPSRLRRGLDPSWDEFVFRLLEEDREERFSDAATARQAFMRLPLVEGTPAAAAPLVAPVAPEPAAAELVAAGPTGRPSKAARGVFASAALLLAGFLAYLEVAHPTLGAAQTFLPLKLGTLFATLFLAWFRKRERLTRPSTSVPLAVALSTLIGGWPLLVYALVDNSPWWAHQLWWVTSLLTGLTCALGVVAGFKLWRVRRISQRPRPGPTPPAKPAAQVSVQVQTPPKRPGLIGVFARMTGLMLGMGVFLVGAAVMIVAILILLAVVA